MRIIPRILENRLIKGDVMETLKRLPDSCMHMVYGDPDYNAGIRYDGRSFTKKWDEYIDWYGALARECLRVLRPDGNLFLINYPKQNAYLRVKHLDEIAYRVSDYVWVYPTNIGHSARRFTTAHRSILHATKSASNRFFKSQVAQPYRNPDDRRIRARIKSGHMGRMPYSWLRFNLVKNVSRDKTMHACQIPLRLFDLLLCASTKRGDSVFILFGGSGSEIVHSHKMGRSYLSCEIHRGYHEMIKDRLAVNGEIAPRYRLSCFQSAKRNGAGEASDYPPPRRTHAEA